LLENIALPIMERFGAALPRHGQPFGNAIDFSLPQL
jgi:hypothetical protein